ncbi:MAG TPA: hypothetical protein VMT64_16830, partial [Candidatus Binataceae bacterium]|nr:hypothetical protein [Candidatus Binataceae bacterium]
NHDRHPHGNRSLLFSLWHFATHPLSGRWRHHFEQYLGEFYPSLINPPEQPHKVGVPVIINLGPIGNEWEIRVAALDSSQHSDAWARGFFDVNDILTLEKEMQTQRGIDLGILLVHHHLLSVRALESSRRHSRGDLLRLTSLVNSGRFSEALAKNHIDVALHGHKHASNWGLYGSLESAGGVTGILGAASGTGAYTTFTGTKCNESHISYNILELGSDRWVRLSVYDNLWERRQFDLFEAETVRKSRFLRRSGTKLKQPPATEIVKHMEFTRQRDGIIREFHTNWVPEEHQTVWTLKVQNSTGTPVDLKVAFTGPDPYREKWPAKEDTVSFKFVHVAEDEDPGTYYFECQPPFNEMANNPQRIDFSYRWRDAAVLTAEELEALDEDRKDWLRKRGYEYAAASVHLLAASLTLIVQIPPELAPEDRDLRVFVRDKDRAAGDQAPVHQPDITRRLKELCPGLYSLVVPFPRPNLLYIVAWKPPRATRLRTMREASLFEKVVAQRGNELAKALRESLESTAFKSSDTQVSLYLPSEDRAGFRLRRMGAFPSTTAVPEYIELGESEPIMTRAWRGEPRWLMGQSIDSDLLQQIGFLPHETTVIGWPIRFDLTGQTGQPWGVMRLGFGKLSDSARELLHADRGEQLRVTLLQPMLKLLADASLSN